MEQQSQPSIYVAPLQRNTDMSRATSRASERPQMLWWSLKQISLLLAGEKRSVTWDKLRIFDIVLTTFGTLGTEYKRREDIDLEKRGNRENGMLCWVGLFVADTIANPKSRVHVQNRGVLIEDPRASKTIFLS